MSDRLPSQGEPYEIVFDGGSLNNPGRGYGSYRLVGPGTPAFLDSRMEFGDRVTNNEAEYLALIRGLEQLLRVLESQSIDPATARLVIRGDSQLVLNQVAGRWKVRSASLQPFNQRARSLLSRIGEVEYAWHPRAVSVRILGH